MGQQQVDGDQLPRRSINRSGALPFLVQAARCGWERGFASKRHMCTDQPPRSHALFGGTLTPMDRWTQYNRLIGASLMLVGVGGALAGFFPLLHPHTPPVATRSGPTLHLSWQVAAADGAGHFASPSPSRPAPTPLPAKAASQKPISKPTATPKAHPARPPVAQPIPPIAAQPAAPKGVSADYSPFETPDQTSGAPSPTRSDTAVSVPASSGTGDLAPSLPAPTPPPLANRLEVHCDDRPPPSYPVAARRSGAEGIVTVRVRLLANGTILQSEIDEAQTSTTHPLLRAAALEAVRRWRCRLPSRPAEEEVVVLQPFRFQLQ